MLLGGGLASAQTPPPHTTDRMEASAQRQMLSINRQKKSVARRPGFFLLPPFSPGRSGSTEPQCAALPSAEVDELVTQAGEASSVPPDLLRTVMKEESGFRPCAVSGKGAMGLMQLMGATANEFGVRNAFDPRENVTAGAKFLKQLIDLYHGDLGLALSAYNAGPRRVDASSGIPEIPETMDYVNRILSLQRSGAAAQSGGYQPLCDACR